MRKCLFCNLHHTELHVGCIKSSTQHPPLSSSLPSSIHSLFSNRFQNRTQYYSGIYIIILRMWEFSLHYLGDHQHTLHCLYWFLNDLIKQEDSIILLKRILGLGWAYFKQDSRHQLYIRLFDSKFKRTSSLPFLSSFKQREILKLRQFWALNQGTW